MPGIRNFPAASRRSAPFDATVSDCDATAVIRSPSTSTLPGKGGAPVPSQIMAPSISRRIVSSSVRYPILAQTTGGGIPLPAVDSLPSVPPNGPVEDRQQEESWLLQGLRVVVLSPV